MVALEEIKDVVKDLDAAKVMDLCLQMPRFRMTAQALKSWLLKVACHGSVLAAKDGGRLAGLACFYANDSKTKKAFLSAIVVDGDYRGKGLGAKMFSLFLARAREAGMTSCELNVVKTNKTAIDFYKRNGLSEAGPGDDEWHCRMCGPL